MCAARLTSRFITNETLLQAWFVLSNADDRDLRQPLLRIVRNRFPMLLDHVDRHTTHIISAVVQARA